jgi:pyruvate/2-oxoglutarate dehydrogenase complex dihydrolipoamide dehydrogenase (E3) component/uncharacterized membrane protein YdjX (TVP38/TMEM64 family)
VLAVMLAAAVVFFALAGEQTLSLERARAVRVEWSDWVAAHYGTALLAYAAIYVLVTALSVPGAAVLTLVGGALFGLWIGTLVVSLASTLGATLAFLLARFLFRDWVRGRFGARLSAIEDGLRRDGAYYLFTLRLVPVFPFFLVNVLMGLTPIRTWTYAWVSQLGMLPATVVYVYAGTQLAELDSLQGILSPGLVLAFTAIGVLPLALRLTSRMLERRRVYRGYRRPHRFDYDLVVIGAGAAGLVGAYVGATLKAKVALIEQHRMGGDCLHTGCVPSKALIRSARLLAEARRSAEFGIRRLPAEFDFAELMARVQRVIAAIEPHDSVARYQALGVACWSGRAHLQSPWEVAVDGHVLRTRSIILATGARPRIPALPGLERIDYLTSENVWQLRTRPRRLLVLGGGAIGCELAQAFARLGSAVTLVEMAPRLLPRSDPGAGSLLAEVFRREGIDLRLGHRALWIEPGGEAGAGELVAAAAAGECRIAFDALLLALGRQPNVEGFGLEELGIERRPDGTLAADPWLRTRFPNIAVCGDVTGPWQYTHAAAQQAWHAAVNQLAAPWWSFRYDDRVLPRVTYTDPQVAEVGLTEDEARARGIAYESTRYGIDDLDRAIADGNAEGYVQVLTEPGRDRVLGACVVHAEAGELIALWVLAIKHGLGLKRILATTLPYPTLMEANKYLAGAWARAHAPGWALGLAERYFTWRRG